MDRQYWYIRYNYEKEFSSDSIIFPIFQKRQPRIKEGDLVLIYSNGHFKMIGLVLESLKTKLEQEELQFEEKIEYKYIIGEFEKIDEPNDLVGFAYSLPKIYKYYNNPEKHFKKDYGRISRYEFRVITQHDYYISRTAFGKIINSLHYDHQLAFFKYATKEFPDLLVSDNKNYLGLFEILKEYVDNHIIAHSKMLIESDMILKSDLKVDSQVGFIDPDDESNKLFVIERQVEKIEHAKKSMVEKITFESIANEIKDKGWEEQYHRRNFNDKQLPLIL